jgi:hypothetical protein
MSKGWAIVLAIILVITLKVINYRFFIQSEKPPKPIRIAGMMEAAFGTLVWGSGLFLIAIKEPRFLGIALMLLGVFWIGVAVSLYKASSVGRAICLALSIIRIPTIIGAIFSLVSINKLYFTQESKNFFNKTFIAKNNP